MRGGLESSSLPLQSLEPAMCNQSVFEEGFVKWQHFSRCRRAPYNRLAEHFSSQTSLAQDHSICSVLAARPLQGNACSERDDTSEVVPGSGRRGWGIQGPHFPVATGKEPGKKGGRGGQLTRGLWLCPGKNNREGPSEGLQLSHPTTTRMHIQNTERGAQYILSSKSMYVSIVPEEPKLFKSLLYNQAIQILN